MLLQLFPQHIPYPSTKGTCCVTARSSCFNLPIWSIGLPTSSSGWLRRSWSKLLAFCARGEMRQGDLKCTTSKGGAAKCPPALLVREKEKETFRRRKHLVFKDQQPAKQVSRHFSFSLMTTRKGWQAPFFNLLKRYGSMWEYWLRQALCAVSFVSERGCLHFEESQWKLYSICGRIIRWSIVVLLEVENELCSRCVIFYRGSNRNISNIEMLTCAVPHAQGVCWLVCEHTYIPVLGGGQFRSGIMALCCAGLQPPEQRLLWGTKCHGEEFILKDWGIFLHPNFSYGNLKKLPPSTKFD